MPPADPQCSVLICAWNGAAVLPACLAALARPQGIPYELIVVDNGSTDGSAELVESLCPIARVIRNGRNLGFGSGNNVGIRAARTGTLLLLNQDTEVPEGWAAGMTAALAAEPRRGAVGCKLVYPDGRLQHCGGLLYPNGLSAHQGAGERDTGQWDAPSPRTYVTAAAIALRRAALEDVGLFDPGFDPAYYEEVDLQARLWAAGWQIWYDPTLRVIHHESQSLGPGSAATVALYTRHRLRYMALHGPAFWRRAALRTEWVWLADMRRKGRLGSALRGWASAKLHWPGWLWERNHRRLPRLEPLHAPGEKTSA